MKFIFPGEPIAKMRHRSAIKYGKIRTYDKQHSVVLSYQVQMMALISQEKLEERKEMAHAEAFDLDLTFYLSYPKKLGKRKIKAIKEGLEKCPANSKPDLDNLIKFYLDIGNGILYKDDKEIVSIKAMKFYDENPRTEFVITPHRGKNGK